MKALIIAAGDGTRMQPKTRGRHKSLMDLLGLKIIERVILGARQAGISEFVIVVGYRGEDIKLTIGDGSGYGVSVTYVENKKWHKANGLSALCAKKYLENEASFVLLMSDHVFDYKTLERLIRIKLNKEECTLAVDKNLDSVLDVDDTTKTVVRAGRVVSIGKSLEKYNAYDTGMFLCSPYLFKVLEQTTSHGKNSLTNGMASIAKENKLRAFNIMGNFWSDCDTWQDIQFAQKKLLKSLTKSKDGVVSKKFNRKISTFFTKFLVRTSIKPNVITFAIPILFGVPTFILLSIGTYPWLLVGGLMIQLMSIIDGCDGEISRLKYLRSVWGKWLDPIMDRYVDTIVIAGMAYGYFRVTGNKFVLPIVTFVMLSEMFSDYLTGKFESQTGKKLRFRGISFKRDLRLLLLSLGAITNQVFVTFIIFIVISQLKFIGQIIAGKRIADEVTFQKRARKGKAIAGLIAPQRRVGKDFEVEDTINRPKQPFQYES